MTWFRRSLQTESQTWLQPFQKQTQYTVYSMSACSVKSNLEFRHWDIDLKRYGKLLRETNRAHVTSLLVPKLAWCSRDSDPTGSWCPPLGYSGKTGLICQGWCFEEARRCLIFVTSAAPFVTFKRQSTPVSGRWILPSIHLLTRWSSSQSPRS